MKLVALTIVGLGFACSGSGNGTPAVDAAATTTCTSISCYVAGEELCDDYSAPTTTQCADVPTSCGSRGGTVAKPSACPATNFKAKCAMPGPGGYVLRFYGNRGGASDESFCTGTAMGTWSTTF